MRAVDLFAGAGGFSTGAQMAGLDVVWAGNHWRPAVDAHAANHPGTVHACQDLHQVDWSTVPPHDILLASPACQGHARARGVDRPHHDACRSTAWAVVSCAEVHRPMFVVVENVPEFSRWVLFPAWIAALRALGYDLSSVVADAADAGVPQHRRRLFVCGWRDRQARCIDMPRREHVPASTIIQAASRWSNISGLCARTRERIDTGRRRHGERFLVAYYGSERGGRSLAEPLGTVTTVARHGLVYGERFRMLSVDEYRAAMGFPDSYALPNNKRTAIHLLGNAVPPPLARDIIREVCG